MRRHRKLLLILCILAGTLLAYGGLTHQSILNVKRRFSPNGDVFAVALPFQGRKPHPLDGTLRLFVESRDGKSSQIQQTTLPVSIWTRLAWIPNADPQTFRIWDWHGTGMVWQMKGRHAECVKGQEFLTSDPYDASTASAL